MMGSPKGSGQSGVSVVIPTHNRLALLRQALRSVAAQSLPPTEIIIADDGSTESFERLMSEYQVTYLRNPHGSWGAAGARNAGLERVRTEYVAFLDSDDLLLPRALELLRTALEESPAAPFAYGRGLGAFRESDGWRPDSLISAEPEEIRDLRAAIFVRNCVPSSGILVRTDVARAVGGYNSSMRFIEDHEFWIRLSQVAQPVHIPELACIYRRHAGNRHTPSLASGEAETIIRLGDRDPRLREVVPDRIGVELCEVSVSAVKSGRPQVAFMVGRRLLQGRGGKGAALRRALSHWRRRRAWRREGLRVWKERPELRDWLSSY